MASPQSIPPIELIKAKAAQEARDSFYAFRMHISARPQVGVTLKRGWFVKDVCENLQQFYDDFIAGKRPKLIIEAPPQHGKSVAVVDFIAWLSGKHPEFRTIYASFSDRLGVRANLRLRRIFANQKFKDVFPDFALGGANNTTLLEFGESGGSFRNTTVMGSITGETLDLGVVDDPLKGREQANSEVFREKTWDWFTDDFFTRFDESAALLCILTRWHVDDPIGRLLAKDPSIKRLCYRAIATEEEKNRKIGDVLFPAHKSLDFILERKKIMGNANFEALYQQNPIIPDGEVIKLKWFLRHDEIPEQVTTCVHSWDTAYKKDEHNDPSSCVVMRIGNNAAFVQEVINKRMEYPELKKTIIALALRDSPIAILIEDKASGQSLIQELRAETGLPIIAVKAEADKLTRAVAASATIEAGRISLPNMAEWLYDYENQLVSFPKGKHDDMVDSTSQFINWWRTQSYGLWNEQIKRVFNL
jgi:predicted phage terminase large subunit-like protein